MPELNELQPDAGRHTLGLQFLRYLCVGAFNTIFGYATYVLALWALSRAIPTRLLYLAAMLAAVLSTPVNITVAYFGYKFFVFRTRGNYLREWAKAFAVYGTSMLIGLVALSALTRFFQVMLTQHPLYTISGFHTATVHLPIRFAAAVYSLANSKALPGYIAGAVITGLSTIYSFIGHRFFTFRARTV